jgi:site-specific DNA-methyltransferase (adenine-specific)
LAVAIEDAGFEIRDNIAWLYGSGFPKSHNISIAIDKQSGAMGHRGKRFENSGLRRQGKDVPDPIGIEAHKPVTDEAKQWDGWGTALKPAHEPIVVARKPLIGTVAQNVLKYGVGGLNIDATRIGTGEGVVTFDRTARTTEGNTYDLGTVTGMRNSDQGRFPANIILDETTAELLDEQTATLKGATGRTIRTKGAPFTPHGTSTGELIPSPVYGDSGGASRFFYVSKASKRDRNEGLDELPDQMLTGRDEGQDDRQVPYKTRSNPVKNTHPTVKPTSLMQYLIRLVTPEGGVVLDPFAGSGSTGKAAILEGKRFIGIELTAEYLPIIEGRLKHAYLTLDDKEDDLFE